MYSGSRVAPAALLSVRLIAILGLLLCVAESIQSQEGSADPFFATIPFADWVAEASASAPNAPGPFHWNPKIRIGDLSRYQRIAGEIEIQVDGIDLAKRREHDSLELLTQITAENGGVFQYHKSLDLDQVSEATAKSDIYYTQTFYAIPGEYRVAFGIYDKVSGERAVVLRTFRVNTLKNDPLPATWGRLPAIEFARESMALDDLFLPYLAPLPLPVKARQPVEVQLLVNTASTPPNLPDYRRFASLGQADRQESLNATQRNLSDVVAAMKVISGVEVQGGSLALSVLDVSRQKKVFDQILWQGAEGRPLDWPALREALAQADPHKIDVRALEKRALSARFFLEQVRKHIAVEPVPEDPPKVLIVLSGPLELSRQESQSIFENVKPGTRVFFIRYHSPLPRPPFLMPRMDRFSRRSGQVAPEVVAAMEPYDSLGSLLKPLRPKSFDVYDAEQFRKALAAILTELAKL